MIILYSILFLWVFYYTYILVMSFYRLHLRGELKGIVWWLALPAVIVGITMDVIAQYTYAAIIFKEWPEKKEYLVTDRLQRYMLQPGTWRFKRAKWICTKLLDPFDPTGKHC